MILSSGMLDVVMVEIFPKSFWVFVQDFHVIVDIFFQFGSIFGCWFC